MTEKKKSTVRASKELDAINVPVFILHNIAVLRDRVVSLVCKKHTIQDVRNIANIVIVEAVRKLDKVSRKK